MTSPAAPNGRATHRPWSNPEVPLVVLDLASVETYLLARPLADLAVEQDGAVWCPLVDGPGALDLDVDEASRSASRLRLPFVRPERHPQRVTGAMRMAALAAARGRGAIFTLRATRLAWATGADLDALFDSATTRGPYSNGCPQGYLPLIANEIGLTVEEAKLAAKPGGTWDRALCSISRGLAELGIQTAPAVRWHGELYTGLESISTAVADSESLHPAVR